jgi:hypothetical protein
MITNLPAAVPSHAPANAAPANPKRKTGLVPMEPGSSHALTITVGGERRVIHVPARAHMDHRNARVRYICLHERCADKTWDDVDAMVAAHPQRAEMAKRDEVHVYGLWSDDPQAEGPRKMAEAALADAEKKLAQAEKLVEKAETVGNLAVAEHKQRIAEQAKRDAEAAVAAASGVIGLIAPPDRGIDG